VSPRQTARIDDDYPEPMPDRSVGRWGSVQVDCGEPVALAAFWSRILGTEVRDSFGDPPHYVVLEPTSAGGPWMSFQRVPEAKATKNRLHLDVNVEDLDRATALVEELGGSRTPGPDLHEYGFSWRVMRDPEGNEFCLILEDANGT
jgi:predicted enzyme related to lactoylglutathione lyase